MAVQHLEDGNTEELTATVYHYEPTHFSTEEDQLPKGYYRSPFFLGTFAALWFGLLGGTGAFAVVAPVLVDINNDIGPDQNYVWLALTYNLTLAIGLLLTGRLSDIFGRRYFFIGGALLAVIGSIVGATARTIPILIGSETLLGIASATQLSFSFALAELVPMKHRFLAMGLIFGATIPLSAMAPAVMAGFMAHYALGWRCGFYLLLGINGVSLICWMLFYFPPTFRMKHCNENYWSYIKTFDYVGFVLFTGGLVTFLMGLSWGGSVYEWKSGPVITTLAIGFCALVALVLWEGLVPHKEPLIPVQLLKNRGLLATYLSIGLGAGQYYALAIVWPQMVGALFSNGDAAYAGVLSSLSGLGINLGEITCGFTGRIIGRQKLQAIVVMFLGGLFFALIAACGPEDKSKITAFVFLGSYFIGYNETIMIVTAGMVTDDQQELGSALGLLGSSRAAISNVMEVVYNTVLTNRLAKTIPREVGLAVVKAGLPISSVATYLKALSAGTTGLAKVPGINSAIETAGAVAYRHAKMDAYHTVFLTTIAFTGLGVVVNCFVPNVDEKMTDDVATTLHKARRSDILPGTEKRLQS
ncbi:hypothetical protein M433DRAFT_76067 [Acidomyces richmondensis BFW]|nr:MAG: hypothetical protein FE78DRAFT_137236 [Acidomyces sp. 'richmondensis']KYG41334.1 hypothetical protein M433DRAFT_76067 [Acidomyces richmondensis BFW]